MVLGCGLVTAGVTRNDWLCALLRPVHSDPSGQVAAQGWFAGELRFSLAKADAARSATRSSSPSPLPYTGVSLSTSSSYGGLCVDGRARAGDLVEGLPTLTSDSPRRTSNTTGLAGLWPPLTWCSGCRPRGAGLSASRVEPSASAEALWVGGLRRSRSDRVGAGQAHKRSRPLRLAECRWVSARESRAARSTPSSGAVATPMLAVTATPVATSDHGCAAIS